MAETEVDKLFKQWLEDNPRILRIDYGLGIEESMIEAVDEVANSVAKTTFTAAYDQGYKQGFHEGIAS